MTEYLTNQIENVTISYQICVNYLLFNMIDLLLFIV